MKEIAVIASLSLIAGLVVLNAPRDPGAGPGIANAAAADLESSAAAAAVDRAPGARTSIADLAVSLDYLERDGIAWMHGESDLNENNGCISCHVVGFTLWGQRAAERAGAPGRATIDALMEEAMEFVARPRIGRSVTWSQLLLGRSTLDEERYDWRAVTDALVASQESDGRWRARGQFPAQRRGEREGDGVATMWALLALDGVAERDDRIEEALTSGYDWLAAEPEGRSSEWQAMRLLTGLRLGDPAAAQERLKGFVAAQRTDGGWSWLIDETADPSDAYSTGVALYTLRRVGLSTSHPAVQAAVDHLLSTRGDGGAWSVPSALTSAEASPERDYIYEYWGTAWAVIGLSEVLPGASPAPGAP